MRHAYLAWIKAGRRFPFDDFPFALTEGNSNRSQWTNATSSGGQSERGKSIRQCLHFFVFHLCMFVPGCFTSWKSFSFNRMNGFRLWYISVKHSAFGFFYWFQFLAVGFCSTCCMRRLVEHLIGHGLQLSCIFEWVPISKNLYVLLQVYDQVLYYYNKRKLSRADWRFDFQIF